jgi:hypothetical protein
MILLVLTFGWPVIHPQDSSGKDWLIFEVSRRDFVQRHGWTTSAMRSYITDVGFVRERVRPSRPYPPGDPTGVHRFARG